MSKLTLIIWAFLTLTVSSSGAVALELDNLLPADVPGYGSAQGVGILTRVHPDYVPLAIHYDTFSLSPSLGAAAGYDSNLNGIGAGSAASSVSPSLLAQNAALGLGAFIAGDFADYPAVTEQNHSGYTLGIGEHALLPRETLTLAAALIDTQETGFGLNTIALTRPVSASVEDLRGSDKIILGMSTLTPEASATRYAFAGYPGQDRTDYRQSLEGEFTSGGPARFVTLLRATESQYRQPISNANSYAALAGVADEASGLWQIRLLAGAAARRPALGRSLDAPVVEASLSWMPTELDSLSFDLAREIDDPDQESADGYTLSQADLSIAHEYLRNVIVTGSLKVSGAAYFNSPLIETLFNIITGINWHLNRAIALDATYAFNDRQSNTLRAANEHIFTMGVTWTP